MANMEPNHYTPHVSTRERFSPTLKPGLRDRLDDLAYVLGVKTDTDLINEMVEALEARFQASLTLARASREARQNVTPENL